ncbi:hypothetical protein JCM5350_003114, partial [Sporobolomyces pararoseus]
MLSAALRPTRALRQSAKPFAD